MDQWSEVATQLSRLPATTIWPILYLSSTALTLPLCGRPFRMLLRVSRLGLEDLKGFKVLRLGLALGCVLLEFGSSVSGEGA